jgi:hypothetical protein
MAHLISLVKEGGQGAASAKAAVAEIKFRLSQSSPTNGGRVPTGAKVHKCEVLTCANSGGAQNSSSESDVICTRQRAMAHLELVLVRGEEQAAGLPAVTMQTTIERRRVLVTLPGYCWRMKLT